MDSLKVSRKSSLFNIKNVQISSTLPTSKPLYLIQSQLQQVSHLQSPYFDVYLTLNGTSSLVYPWKCLDDLSQSPNSTIVCVEKQGFTVPKKEVASVNELTVFYDPLLRLLQQNKECSTIWSVINCLPIPYSINIKQDTTSPIPIDVYTSLLSVSLDQLPHALKLLTILVDNNTSEKCVAGNILHIIQPMVCCYNTVISSCPTPTRFSLLLIQMLSNVNTLILKRALKVFKHASLFIQYQNLKAWTEDITSHFTTATETEEIVILDNDYEMIINFLYYSSSLHYS